MNISSIRHTIWTWLRYCSQVVLGILAGGGLVFLCIVLLAGAMYLWALWAGSLLALIIWIVIALISTIHMRRHGWNSGYLRFLAGCALIPCYLGIDAIIVLSTYGPGNPIIG